MLRRFEKLSEVVYKTHVALGIFSEEISQQKKVYLFKKLYVS